MDKDGLDFDRFRDSEVCGPIHRTEILFVSVCPFSLTSHTKQTLIHVVWHLCGRGTCFIVRLRAAVLRKKKSQIEFKLFEETPLNYPWEMCLLCCFEHKLKTSLNKIVFKPFFFTFLPSGQITKFRCQSFVYSRWGRFLLPDEPCRILGKLSNTSCYCCSSAAVSSTPLEQKSCCPSSASLHINHFSSAGSFLSFSHCCCFDASTFQGIQSPQRF